MLYAEPCAGGRRPRERKCSPKKIKTQTLSSRPHADGESEEVLFCLQNVSSDIFSQSCLFIQDAVCVGGRTLFVSLYLNGCMLYMFFSV